MIGKIIQNIKTLRLGTKVTLCIAMVQIPLLVFAAAVEINNARQEYLETISWRSKTLAQPLLKRVAELNEYPSEKQRTLGLSVDCQILLKENIKNGVVHVGVLGIDGEVIAHTTSRVDQNKYTSYIEELDLSPDTQTADGELAYHALVPVFISTDSSPVALVDIGFSRTDVDSRIRTTIVYAAVTFLLFLFISFILISFLLNYFVTQPIATLSEAAASMARGQLLTYIDVSGSDEIGVLAKSFEKMRESISDQIFELQQKDFIIRSSPSAVLTTSLEGKLTYANPTFLKLWGFASEADILGKSFQDFWQIDNELDDIIVELLENETKWTGEIKATKANGTVFDVFFSAATVLNDEVLPVGLMLTSIDISQRKRIENELKDFAQRLSIHLEQTPLGVIEWDLNFQVSQWNKAAERIFGYSKDEIIGQAGLDLFIPERSSNTVQAVWNDFINHQGGNRSTNENVTKDGRVIVCEWYNTALLDNNGVTIGVASLIQDITDKVHSEREKEKLQEDLRQAQKMEAVGTLAGGIAHDFNNILSAIIGYTDLARVTLPPDSKTSPYLRKVLTASNRAKELVLQILAFSRQSEIKLTPIKIHTVVEEALKLIRSTIPTTIQIHHDIDPESGTVLSDSTQIHQIVMNLCTNAYHAMRSTGGILSVSLQPIQVDDGDYVATQLDLTPGQYAELNISDNGMGMDKDTVEKIFDPYFTTKAKGEGTGLGLSVVHGIVRDYSGQIVVKSEHGKGTTFQIFFPHITEETTTSVTNTEKYLPRGSERVLVVDDETELVIMVEVMLTGLGYKVTSTTSSTEALQLCQTNPSRFDLAITDMNMPRMNGLELIKEIQKLNTTFPFILFTGFSELITQKAITSLGIKKVLMKPLLWADLAESVREVLDGEK